jgi:hypothetical protein
MALFLSKKLDAFVSSWFPKAMTWATLWLQAGFVEEKRRTRCGIGPTVPLRQKKWSGVPASFTTSPKKVARRAN